MKRRWWSAASSCSTILYRNGSFAITQFRDNVDGLYIYTYGKTERREQFAMAEVSWWCQIAPEATRCK
jgi:hypothetical protein